MFTRSLRNIIATTLAALFVGGFFLHTGFLTNLYSRFSPQSGHSSPYMLEDAGRPVGWNPCAPIDYVINFAHAPAYARQDLSLAINTLEAASGLKFVYTGSTDLVPDTNWSTIPRLHRRTWAPLIIAFANPSATNMFTFGSSQIGAGGPAWVNSSHGKVDVSGAIVIDDRARFIPGFGPGLSLGTLLLHELGHVVGLAEGTDPASFTYKYLGITTQAVTRTDIAHLRALTSGGCRPAPQPAWA